LRALESCFACISAIISVAASSAALIDFPLSVSNFQSLHPSDRRSALVLQSLQECRVAVELRVLQSGSFQSPESAIEACLAHC